jgi:AcrR family transcriptional regulator
MNAARTARDRVRTEITAEIKAAAKRLLESGGAAGLSLRAVARGVGMVPSALYRYYANRDDLLTALIIDAFDEIGEAAEHADLAAREAGADPAHRWLRVCRAVREWAIGHRHEFALVYGTPVADYAAPADTIGPATRITGVP